MAGGRDGLALPDYAAGLADLGHDVYYVEDSDNHASCFNPSTMAMSTDPTDGLRFARDALSKVGIADRWAYYDEHHSTWHGDSAGRILRILRTADVVLNISGVNPVRPWLSDIPARDLIDTDPAFRSSTSRTHGPWSSRAVTPTSSPSVRASARSESRCWTTVCRGVLRRSPSSCGIWPMCEPRPHARFTTVMQWDSYPSMHHRGTTYGMKSASFAPYLELPRRCSHATFELAATRVSEGWRHKLAANQWRLRQPGSVSPSPCSYQAYVSGSLAEFSVAKQGYVEANTGWFSERSPAYLATGRPVVTQVTGASSWLAVGSGLLMFSSPDEAHACVESAVSDHERHHASAREVAEQHFNANLPLGEKLGEIYGTSH